jgi:hypothetical protein
MKFIGHNIFGIALSVTLFVFANLVQTEGRAVYVAAGFGIDGITVGYSTKNSVTSKYGDDYALIEHNHYSYEIRYRDTGMSFWYRYEDPASHTHESNSLRSVPAGGGARCLRRRLI